MQRHLPGAERQRGVAREAGPAMPSRAAAAAIARGAAGRSSTRTAAVLTDAPAPPPA